MVEMEDSKGNYNLIGCSEGQRRTIETAVIIKDVTEGNFAERKTKSRRTTNLSP